MAVLKRSGLLRGGQGFGREFVATLSVQGSVYGSAP